MKLQKNILPIINEIHNHIYGRNKIGANSTIILEKFLIFLIQNLEEIENFLYLSSYGIVFNFH